MDQGAIGDCRCVQTCSLQGPLCYVEVKTARKPLTTVLSDRRGVQPVDSHTVQRRGHALEVVQFPHDSVGLLSPDDTKARIGCGHEDEKYLGTLGDEPTVHRMLASSADDLIMSTKIRAVGRAVISAVHYATPRTARLLEQVRLPSATVAGVPWDEFNAWAPGNLCVSLRRRRRRLAAPFRTIPGRASCSGVSIVVRQVDKRVPDTTEKLKRAKILGVEILYEQ
mgnify:CR=1 FL=1